MVFIKLSYLKNLTSTRLQCSCYRVFQMMFVQQKNVFSYLVNMIVVYYFWLYHPSRNSLQLKPHLFLHHINHQCVQSFQAPWFQTFLDRQISFPFCVPVCFFSCVQSYWSINPLIHSAAYSDGKCFPWDMFPESLFSQPPYIHSSQDCLYHLKIW